jgi:hypothetical protein
MVKAADKTSDVFRDISAVVAKYVEEISSKPSEQST